MGRPLCIYEIGMAQAVPNAAHLLSAAAVARQRGDRREEARLVAAAMAAAPDNPQCLNADGMLALAARDFARAQMRFAAAAALDPGEPALWMNVATAQRALDDAAGERTSLEKVLAIDRRHFMALLRLAELQQRTGQLIAAMRTWKTVLALSAVLDPLPPALAETLALARLFVADQMEEMAGAMDAALAQSLDVHSDEQTRRVRATLDHMLGRRKIYRNECAGIYVPFLPADEFFDRGHFPWFAALEAKTDVIREEFYNLLDRQSAAVRPYVLQDSGMPQNKWSPLDGSLDWGACFLWEYGVRNDAVCVLCPETAAALEALPRNDIPNRAPSAFFSLLRPHTRLPAHTGVTNSRAIIHLPLIVPEGCGFRVGNETRQWREGEAFAFDDTIEHEAWNDSEDLRVVLIFDTWNPHLTGEEQALLKQMFEVVDLSGESAGR
ncbi:hypothetical protein BH10PSE12_BH10PSE12_09260 [soil metagenome]